MAKRNETGTLFPNQSIVLPEGYYSGDKPNPNLRAFVEAHCMSGPTTRRRIDYNVPAFDQADQDDQGHGHLQHAHLLVEEAT